MLADTAAVATMAAAAGGGGGDDGRRWQAMTGVAVTMVSSSKQRLPQGQAPTQSTQHASTKHFCSIISGACLSRAGTKIYDN